MLRDLFTDYREVQYNIYRAMCTKLVRVPSLVFSQLFGVCFRFHRSEAARGGGGGAGSHNICGLLPTRILNAGGGGGAS
jgi:hypothetical protein